jgi:hypothetical protein
MGAHRILFFTAILACACSPASSSHDGDTGSASDSQGSDTGTDTSACETEGEPMCDGNTYMTCEDGAWTAVEDCPDTCLPAAGCVLCPPGEAYCEGTEVRACDPNGQSFTAQMDCADYDLKCVDGECQTDDPCVKAAIEKSNAGCEFWPVDLDQWYDKPGSLSPDASGKQYSLVVTNPGDTAVTVTTEINEADAGAPLDLAVVDTREVGPKELVRIDLPQREVDGSLLGKNEGTGTALSSRAYRVTSSAPIVAYQFNPIMQLQTNDASILLPTSALDKRHWVLGYAGVGVAVMPPASNFAFLAIVGTEAGTEVDVTTTADVGAGGPVADWTQHGATIHATLGPFDVLNLEAKCKPGMNVLTCMNSQFMDFTGSLVVASKPVAVYSGTECTNVAPASFCTSGGFCDHLEDQIFPTTSLGKRFVAPHSPYRGGGEPDVWRLLADADGTTVTTSLPAPDDSFTLKAGKWREVFATQPFAIDSTGPLLIGQYLVGQECTTAGTGDPSFTTFPPVEQFRKDYTFLVPKTFDKDYVVIASPVGAAISLDGVDLGASDCTAYPVGDLGGVTYETNECLLADGVHRLAADTGVGILVAGYGPAGSYAYPGGANIERINNVD